MCTEFFLLTNESNLISGRTFDFPFDPVYMIGNVKKNDKIFIINNDKKINYYSDSKYNFIYLYCFNNIDLIAEGMNEKGLIINSLWLEDTIYADIKYYSDDYIYFLDIPKLILSQCQNIIDVIELLKNKKIWTEKVILNNQENQIIGKLHYSVHDKNHESIIIEVDNGVVKFITNELQVITNQPFYSWHEKNIDNYLHLNNKTIVNNNTNKKIFHTNVNGNGLIGLPGDFTSISRFIKTQKLISFIPQKKYNDLVSIAIIDKILGNIIIPYHGMMEEKNNQELEAHTYYSIIKNQNKLEWYIKKDIDINYKIVSMNID